MKGQARITSDPDQQISMPPELMRFIERDSYSLLIKGYAGTGKTTLALTILRALGRRNSFFYISTRISPKELFSYYPWLSQFTNNRDARKAGNSSMLSTFEDARLDEPESLFERITNQLMDIKSPVIVVDSWDAIASFMDREGRLNNERVLQTWRERAGAKLIFISEDPDDTTLDFLVGGMVELKQRHLENVRYREIILLKLRGVRIDRPSYVYTLEHSIFRSFNPYMPAWSRDLPGSDTGSSRLTAILSASKIKSGSAALDTALGGGFPRFGTVLVEYDRHLSSADAISIVGGLASTFVSMKNPVLIQPGGSMEPRELMGLLHPFLPPKNADLVKILWPRKYAGLSRNVLVEPRNYKAAILRMRRKHPGKLLLNVILGHSARQRDRDGELTSRLHDEIEAARSCDLSVVLAAAVHSDQIEYYSRFADVRMRLVLLNDTLFLQSLMPASSLYAVGFNKGRMTLDAVV